VRFLSPEVQRFRTSASSRMQSCRSLVHKKTLRREQLEKAVRAAKRDQLKKSVKKSEQLKKESS
jgi:hypothetical protein